MPTRERPLSVVLVNTRKRQNFAGLPALVRRLKERYPAGEPHVFLFPEGFFRAYATGHAENKRKLARAVAELADAPEWRLAFSNREYLDGGKRSPANAGYLVHAAGYQAYPKRALTGTDRDDLLKAAFLKDAEFGALETKWRDRAEKNKGAYPGFEHGGKKFEYRVCGDARRSAREPADVTLLSATDLPADAWGGLGDLAKRRRVIITNDDGRLQSGGSKAVIDGEAYHLDREFTEAALALAGRGIALSRYNVSQPRKRGTPGRQNPDAKKMARLVQLERESLNKRAAKRR